jgi:flagellar M-ring protein FliF
MALDLQQVRYRTADVLGGFTLGQKVMTVVTVAAIVVGGLMFTRWASQPSYGPLFTSLESADAAAVTEALGARGVPYQLGDGGRTILVPQDRLYQLRLDMSAEGLPSGGTSRASRPRSSASGSTTSARSRGSWPAPSAPSRASTWPRCTW